MSELGLARRAARFVITRGLISHEEVHRYGIRARDLSQSNGVALVESGNGRGFVAKDMRPTRSGDQGSPERELGLYRAISGRKELEAFTPRFHGYDDGEHILLIEGLSSSRRLDQLGGGRSVLDPELAGRVGAALGLWHLRAAALDGLDRAVIWFLGIDGENRLAVLDADARLRELTLKILSDPELKKCLVRVRAHWTDETVIHGDVRFANVMVCPAPQVVRFIDWETSGMGDPAWDVAGGVQEYLSVGIAGGHPLESSPAGDPVEAFLRRYRETSRSSMPWSRFAPFVACRLMMRALQLTLWDGDAREATEQHLKLAAEIGTRTESPFERVPQDDPALQSTDQ